MEENQIDKLDKVEFVRAKPEVMPPPSYWPFVFAVSLMFLGWGLLTVWILSVAGLIGMAISLCGWIKDMLYERRQESGKPEELPH